MGLAVRPARSQDPAVVEKLWGSMFLRSAGLLCAEHAHQPEDGLLGGRGRWIWSIIPSPVPSQGFSRAGP